MPFNTQNFIFVFLPFLILSYYLAGDRLKNGIILIYSILFYVIGNYRNPENIVILATLMLINYVFGFYIIKMRKEKERYVKYILIFSIIFNVLVLCFFKSQLFVKILPLGISFYVFHFISILLDSYKSSFDDKEFNFFNYINYILFFPKILSGPITRYGYYVSEYKNKNQNKNIIQGIYYFAIGLALKCLLSNNISYIINQINVYGFESISIGTAWIGMYSYTMSLYFDFAGYSLMAIGLANIIGMNLPNNFDLPFCSKSVSEFWRRWHISLGHFFREYIYIPLGGNCGNKNLFRQCVNLGIVWLVTGFWHGFKMNYILWAMLICIIIIIEKIFLIKFYKKHEIVGRIIVCLLMPFAFLIFSIENLSNLQVYISRLFALSSINQARDLQVILPLYGKIFVVGIIFMTKYPKIIMNIVAKNKVLMIIVSIALIILSAYMINVSSVDTFKYFTF